MSPEELRDIVAAKLPDAPLVVALGGGADSAVTVWACSGHQPVRAVFVDHHLEGSPDLLAAAQRLSDEVAVPLTVLSAPVRAGANLEARAREARWSSIRAGLSDGEVAVTGHSQDDLAETVVMNLMRGSGSTGLAAMAARRDDVIRPMTGFSRAELRQFAETLGLPFADDPANTDQRHLRNRIRADLIPLLESDYQPGLRAILARTATHLAGDDAALEEAAARIPVHEDAGALLIPVPILETIQRPVAERAVRRALRRLHPPYPGSASDVDSVFLVAAGRNRRATLTLGITVSCEGPYVALWAGEPSVPDAAELPAPGSAGFGDAVISARRAAAADLHPLSTALVDPVVFEAGVTLRTATMGERIDISNGTKLVRDALAEVGVPVRKRAAWPVLANDAKIAAIVGGRVAPWARPTGADAVFVTQEHA